MSFDVSPRARLSTQGKLSSSGSHTRIHSDIVPPAGPSHFGNLGSRTRQHGIHHIAPASLWCGITSRYDCKTACPATRFTGFTVSSKQNNHRQAFLYLSHISPLFSSSALCMAYHSHQPNKSMLLMGFFSSTDACTLVWCDYNVT